MRFKIRGGTAPASDAPLCHTCRFATIIRGQRLDDEIIECRMVDQRIPFAATSCTRYANFDSPSLHDLEEIAWILRSDARRKTVGFGPSKSLKISERFVLDEE